MSRSSLDPHQIRFLRVYTYLLVFFAVAQAVFVWFGKDAGEMRLSLIVVSGVCSFVIYSHYRSEAVEAVKKLEEHLESEKKKTDSGEDEK